MRCTAAVCRKSPDWPSQLPEKQLAVSAAVYAKLMLRKLMCPTDVLAVRFPLITRSYNKGKCGGKTPMSRKEEQKSKNEEKEGGERGKTAKEDNEGRQRRSREERKDKRAKNEYSLR